MNAELEPVVLVMPVAKVHVVLLSGLTTDHWARLAAFSKFSEYGRPIWPTEITDVCVAVSEDRALEAISRTV
jgi:hypothetical protein